MATTNPGLLMIVGGDDDRENFWQTAAKFTMNLKQKQRIAVLMEEYDDWKEWMPEHEQRWRDIGYQEIRFFLPKVRDSYSKERVIDLIMWADVIFIWGGDTRKYHRYYCTVKISKALCEGYLISGKSVAGMSAGALLFPRRAIISGEEVRTGGKFPPLRVKANIIHPRDDGDHRFRMGRGFGLMDNILVDVHFTEWGRYPRLAYALSRPGSSVAGLLGIGLDADAAAILFPDGTAKTLGQGSVTLMRLNSPAHGRHRAVVEMKRLKVGDKFKWTGQKRLTLQST